MTPVLSTTKFMVLAFRQLWFITSTYLNYTGIQGKTDQ